MFLSAVQTRIFFLQFHLMGYNHVVYMYIDADDTGVCYPNTCFKLAQNDLTLFWMFVTY